MNWGRHVASGIQLHSEVSALMCSRSCCSRLLQAGDGADGSSGFLPLLGETWVGFPLGAVGPDRGPLRACGGVDQCPRVFSSLWVCFLPLKSIKEFCKAEVY